MKNRTIYKIKIFLSAFAVLLFAAIIIWFVSGLSNTERSADEERLRNVKQSVVNGAVLCYSVEGCYPEDLGYLKDNYGVSYDENKYLVHYRYVSADIRPTVAVYVHGQEEDK